MWSAILLAGHTQERKIYDHQERKRHSSWSTIGKSAGEKGSQDLVKVKTNPNRMGNKQHKQDLLFSRKREKTYWRNGGGKKNAKRGKD